MSNWVMAVLCTSLLIGCGGGGATDPVKIVIYGDSLIFGYDLEVSPVKRMRTARPDWEIEDRSVGGLQMKQLWEGYKEPFDDAPAWTYPTGPQPAFKDASRNADVVVMQLGVNDSFHDASGYEHQLRAAIEILRSEGRIVVLTGIVGMNPDDLTEKTYAESKRLNSITHQLAKEYGLQHAGWGEDYKGPSDLDTTKVHRTQDASDRLAALTVQAIERSLK